MKPNEKVEVLLKCLSLREVSINPRDVANSEIIKSRKVQVLAMLTNKTPVVNIEVNVVP